MKFVLNASRIACWDFATIAARAKEAGYEGVELGASADVSQFTSANVLLSDLNKVRGIFDSAGVDIVALSNPLAIDPGDKSFGEQMAAILDASGRLGSRIVRIQHRGSTKVGRRGEVPSDQLMRILDDAGDRSISIVVENAPVAASVKELWVLLERLEHPSLGCSLNLLNATLAGQSPYQIVPTLNQKILYAQVSDARLDGATATPCKVGDGNVPVQDFLIRLRGVGYGGYMALELRGGAGSEEIARDGVLKLREWAQPREALAKGAARRRQAGAR